MLASLNNFHRFASFLGIKPLGSRGVVELNKAGAGKIGNLYVPDSAQKAINQGTVKAVGPGAICDGKILPMTLKVGMKVLLPQFGGQVVKIGKEEVTVINEEDILGYFE